MGQIGKLYTCLEKLDGLNLDTLADRKLLQKKIYFLQEFGVYLGYSFGFYIYGPYSSELTNDAYFLSRQRTEAPTTVDTTELFPREKEAIVKAIDFFSGIKGSTAEIAYQLELLSSLHFLWKFSYFKNKAKEEIFKKLKDLKNIKNNADLEAAWRHLVRYGLIS